MTLPPQTTPAISVAIIQAHQNLLLIFPLCLVIPNIQEKTIFIILMIAPVQKVMSFILLYQIRLILLSPKLIAKMVADPMMTVILTMVFPVPTPHLTLVNQINQPFLPPIPPIQPIKAIFTVVIILLYTSLTIKISVTFAATIINVCNHTQIINFLSIQIVRQPVLKINFFKHI